jgi:hypothetical protein
MPTHPYKLKSGKRVPGVTTILSRWKESGGLIAWSYNTGYEHGEAGMPKNRFAVSDEAAGIGTYTHALFEWHLNGENGPEPDPATMIKPEYLNITNIDRGRNGYAEALKWESQTGLFLLSLETPLVSERHRYGGTPDGVTERDNKIGIADWKTSKRLYPDYLIQVAAYKMLWEENHPDQPITDGVHIVRFSKDYGDFAHWHFDDLEVPERQFVRLREAYEDDKLIGGRF